jgi:hypothetical protein
MKIPGNEIVVKSFHVYWVNRLRIISLTFALHLWYPLIVSHWETSDTSDTLSVVGMGSTLFTNASLEKHTSKYTVIDTSFTHVEKRMQSHYCFTVLY